MFSLGKIVTLVQDNLGAVHIGMENKDIGIGMQGAEHSEELSWVVDKQAKH